MGVAGAAVFMVLLAATGGGALAALPKGIADLAYAGAAAAGAAAYGAQTGGDDMFGLDTAIGMVEFIMEQIEDFENCQSCDYMDLYFETKNGRHVLRAHFEGQNDYDNPVRAYRMPNCTGCRGVYEYFFPIIGDRYTRKN
jgi:hypothetical protein